ncbi:hypothetical protein RHSIM_Rhsim06G0018000 [Rhododendron simsii]|uniref:Uncharacterized protein n=1 Tax=Rhododendron simsii TaxID=118357 RepID=A0A834GX74_RHOSS|nr:hypothetical protein RHSIM_Rhsim06G0018000 [Rhododendron simsii]
MKGHSISLLFYLYLSLLLYFSLLRDVKASDEAQNNGVYVVYMGAATSQNGFAARLSKEEANSIAQRLGVVSVFPDLLLKLHTTGSWDFLKYQTDLETGIWLESPSFTDKGMGPIPSWWKGTCMEGEDFTSSHCNRKVIGARYYNEVDDESDRMPRDRVGHGTHVASTAAGIPIPSASYYGLPRGTAKGGSPGSRIAVYRVCDTRSCPGSAILAAFDDANADGVDVLSVSLGTEASDEIGLWSSVIAIGSFHAVEKGITVVCSGGNDGPMPGTLANIAPWILTVAATTTDRDFVSDVVLVNSRVIKGGGIHFGNLQKDPIYPLIYGMDAKSSGEGFVTYDDDDSRNCKPPALEGNKIKGKDHYDDARAVASTYGTSPISIITEDDGTELLLYIHSSRNPVATILPTVTVTQYKPAPILAAFSSRGPAFELKQLLKARSSLILQHQELTFSRLGQETTRQRRSRTRTHRCFIPLSGTSMSCPHIAGIAAAVKSQYPTWSPSGIKSAIMTTGFQIRQAYEVSKTLLQKLILQQQLNRKDADSISLLTHDKRLSFPQASQTNNMKGPITTALESVATPYDYGAGEVTTTGPTGLNI